MIIDALHGSPNIKPAMWAIDPGIIAHNASRMGLPIFEAGYVWGSGDQWPDLSGNGYNGILDSTINWVITPYGSAVHMDSSGEQVNFGTIDLTSNYYTVMIIVKPESLVNYNGFINNNGWDGFNLHARNDGTLYAGTGNTNRIQTSSSYLVAGRWYKLIIQLTPDGHKLWRNGVLTHTNSNTPTPVWGDCYIGSVANPAMGPIPYLVIFSTPLSPSQVAILSANPFGLARQPSMEELWAYVEVGDGPTMPIFDYYYNQARL